MRYFYRFMFSISIIIIRYQKYQRLSISSMFWWYRRISLASEFWILQTLSAKYTQADNYLWNTQTFVVCVDLDLNIRRYVMVKGILPTKLPIWLSRVRLTQTTSFVSSSSRFFMRNRLLNFYEICNIAFSVKLGEINKRAVYYR